MKRYLFLIALACSLLAGCQSAEEKALDAAIEKNDLAALREFAATYGSSMNEKVSGRYYNAYKRLEEDSTLFSAVQRASSILAKCKAEEKYLATFPNGVHAAEVSASLAEHKKQAEELAACLEGLRSAFKQYKYVEKSRGGKGTELEFTAPDESGKGEISGSSSFTVNKFNSKQVGARVICTRSGSYYIDDNRRIVAHVEETRSYQGATNDKYWNNRTIKEARSKYPAPRPRTITVTPSANFQTLTGHDESGDCTFEAVLK
jgi:hypothetical protein